MNTLGPPDSLHVQAAQGWLELGNPSEASHELEKIAPAFRMHPAVLMIRWKIYAKLGQWEQSLELADTLIKLAPEIPVGWIDKATAFHALKRYQDAHAALSPALAKFPGDPLVLYDMACYECLLGYLDKAQELLKKVFATDESMVFKNMAMLDPDLEALRAKIAEL